MVELELEDDNEEVLDKELKLEDEEINEKLILEYEEEPELEDKEDVIELEDEEDMVEPENEEEMVELEDEGGMEEELEPDDEVEV